MTTTADNKQVSPRSNISAPDILERSLGADTKKSKRSWWRVSIEFTAFSVIAIAGLECFFNLTGVGQQEFLEPDLTLGCKHIPNKLVTWRLEGFSSDKINSQGLRDKEYPISKAPNVVRIATLGDSSTEGLQVPLNETYAKVLEKSLNTSPKSTANKTTDNNNDRNPQTKFEVINFACSSYSTGQQFIQLKNDVLKYKPDIVTILYNRGDALENVRDPRSVKVEPRPYFFIDPQGKVTLDAGVLQAQQAKLRPSALITFLRQNSRIYGVLTQADLSLSINEKLYRRIKGWGEKLGSIFTPKIGGKPASISETKQLSGIKATALAQTAITSAPTSMPDSWKVTAELVKALNQECKANGAKLVVLVFPNTLYFGDLIIQADALQKLGKKEGFTVMDLTEPFMYSGNPNALFLQYHFSAKGHKLVAERLEALLTKEELLSK